MLSNLSVEILTNDKFNFRTELIDNNYMKHIIWRFIQSDYSSNSFICGHFLRLVYMSATHPSGKFIKDFPELREYILKNISNLTMRQLIIDLATDEVCNFDFDVDYASRMCDQLENTKNTFFVISAFRIMLQISNRLTKVLADPVVFTKILKCAIATPNYLVQQECFVCLYHVLLKFSEVRCILDKYESQYKFSPDNINCATAAALSVFPHNVTLFIDKFFESHSNTWFDSAVFRAFGDLRSDQFAV